MKQPAQWVPVRRPVVPYVVRCIGESGRRFQVRGIFGSDWEAIDSALEHGAVVALPRRHAAGPGDRLLTPAR